MTRDELIRSAAELQLPSPLAYREYASKGMVMAEMVSERIRVRPDMEILIGPGNLDMMLDNHRNHARFMESVFRRFDPQVLVDTVLWVFRAYRAHGFTLTYWPAQLDTWVVVMTDQMTRAAFDEIYPFYAWMIVNQPAFAVLTEVPIQCPERSSAATDADAS